MKKYNSKKAFVIGALSYLALISGCATLDSTRKTKALERETVTSEDGTFTRKTGEANINETIYDGWLKKEGKKVANEMIFDGNSDGLFNEKDSYHYVSKTSDEKKYINAGSADKAGVEYCQKRLERIISAFEKKNLAPSKSENIPALQDIIAQYMKSNEQVLIKSFDKDKKELGQQMKGGELNVYSADKGNIYSKNFGIDDAVEFSVKELAGGKYRIIYKKGGKSYSTKLQLGR